MFKFDFGDDINSESVQQQNEQKITVPITGKKLSTLDINHTDSVPIIAQLVKTSQFNLFQRTVHDINFEIYQSDDQHANLSDALMNSTDLISNVYEGGCKTWECSIDLMNYLMTIPNEINGTTILELGCGSGLPGLAGIGLNAVKVDFQDYNEEVIKLVTLPNVLINTIQRPNEIELDGMGNFEMEIKYSLDIPSEFYSGDWLDLTNIIEENKYDVILSSETIYEAENIPKLLKIIQKVLKRSGFALIAAKHNYFGCTGSLQLFKQHAIECSFQCDTVFCFSSGVRREIVKLYY
ncbi:hypothetical protein BC833DRAFT_597696 [Globomyces pollinis-pini]|nr:hypothetical protein BC833DRAFT_597696 [Globomyces pollinis-pini]